MKMKKKNNTKVDRISDLPNSIIHYIFSFMDMKLVVQTCVLSKRWKSLWSSTPYMRFDMYDVVDRVLLHCDACRIITLRLYSELNMVSFNVYSWFLMAIKRHVQELCLEFCVDGIPYLEFPYNLFTSGITKFVLKIKSSYFSCNSNEYTPMPKSMCTSKSIKTLHLEHITLPKGNPEGELILSCPVLEDLIIKYFNDDHLKCFTISAPRLQKLDLLARNSSEIPTCTIKICSPDLTSLKCAGYISSPWLLENLSAIQNASIMVYGDDNKTCGKWNTDEKELYAKYLLQVLKSISNVTVLTISTRVLKASTDSPDIFERLPNLFHTLREFTLDEEDDQAFSNFAIVNFLSRLPCIQTFVWKRYKVANNPLQKRQDRDEDMPINHNDMHSLKDVEIQTFNGTRDELKFVEFIFARVVPLKKMAIVTTTHVSRDRMEVVSVSTSFCKRHNTLSAGRRRLTK